MADRLRSAAGRALFFLPLLAVALLFGLRQVCDYDIFGHIVEGKSIIDFGFLDYDIFTFTFQGKPWANIYWLFQLLAFFTYSHFGFPGIIAVKALCTMLIMLFLYLAARNRAAGGEMDCWPVFIPILLLGFSTAGVRIVERPHMVGLLMVSFYLFALTLPEGRARAVSMGIMPFLQILWVNMHGSFVIGPLLVAIFLFEEVWNRVAQTLKASGAGVLGAIRETAMSVRRTSPIFTMSVLTVVLLLVNFISPISNWTYGMIRIFREEEYLSLTRIAEWAPPTLTFSVRDLSWAFFYEQHNQILALMVLFVTAASCRARKLRVSDVLLFIVGFTGFLSHTRFVGDFGLFITPGAVAYWCAIYRQSGRWKGRLLALSLSLLVFFFTFFWVRAALASGDYGFSVNRGRFCFATARFIKAENLRGNMFNHYNQGYFLSQQLYPQVKIFIDGRPVILFNPAFFFVYSLGVAGERFDVIENSYGFNMVLIDRDAPLFRTLLKSSRWRLVYAERVCGLFIRNEPGLADLRELKVSWVNGDVFPMSGDERKKAVSLIDDLQKKSGENSLLLYVLSQIYWMDGRRDDALSALERAQAYDPEFLLPYVKRCEYLCGLSKVREALGVITRASYVFPEQPLVLLKQSRCYMLLGNERKAWSLMERYMMYYRDIPSIEAFTRMGMLAINVKKDGKLAVEYFTMALYMAGSQDEEIQSLFNLANAYGFCAMYEEAKKIYIEILKKRPYNAEAWFDLGEVLFTGGNNDKAAEAFRRAAGMNDEKWSSMAKKRLEEMGVPLDRPLK